MGILSDENRMCTEIMTTVGCSQCPIYKKATKKMTSCTTFKMSFEKESIQMINEWKKNHKTLITESAKKTLKALHTLGFRTISRNLVGDIRCNISIEPDTVLTSLISPELKILKDNVIYKISDLIDKSFLEEVIPVLEEVIPVESENNKAEHVEHTDFKLPDIPKETVPKSELTKDMLKDGLFVYNGFVDRWGIVVGDKIIYNNGGYDLISDDLVLEDITKVVECDYGFDSIEEYGKVIFEIHFYIL